MLLNDLHWYYSPGGIGFRAQDTHTSQYVFYGPYKTKKEAFKHIAAIFREIAMSEDEEETEQPPLYTITKGTENIVLDAGEIMINNSWYKADKETNNIVDAVYEILPEKTILESRCE